jgi:hypothetical protein
LAYNRSIQAADILVDIRREMTDSELMNKYRISRKDLRSILKQLAEERDARAIEIVLDIRAGLSDRDLMQKHGLSRTGLLTAFHILVKGKFISEDELYERVSSDHNDMPYPAVRKVARNHPLLPILVHDKDHPENVGRIRDMTEKGLGLRGFQARAGETKVLVIEANELGGYGELTVRAKCRWIKEDVEGERFAGFRILQFLKGKYDDLRFVVRVHNVRYRGKWDQETERKTSQAQLDATPSIKSVKARTFVEDVRSGFTDADLMDKYRVSPSGLKRIYRKLVHTKAIGHNELCEISPYYRDASPKTERRALFRTEVTVPLQIRETGSSWRGYVRDISERGLRVAGMSSEVGDRRHLGFIADVAGHEKTLNFEGMCRWTEIRGRDNKYIVAGYEITWIRDDTLRDLREFVRSTALSRWDNL